MTTMNAAWEFQNRFDTADMTAKLADISTEADYKLAGAEAQRNYSDQLGDVDVWASEQNLSLAKSAAASAKGATDKQYSALANLGRRQTGGGTFGNSFGGRNRINLGSISGGLEAANNAKVKGELDKVVASKKADLSSDLAANQTYASAAKAAANEKTANEKIAAYAANKWNPYEQKQQEQDMLDTYGEATGVGNQRRRRSKVTGEVELSDYYGNFPA